MAQPENHASNGIRGIFAAAARILHKSAAAKAAVVALTAAIAFATCAPAMTGIAVVAGGAAVLGFGVADLAAQHPGQGPG